MSKQAIGDALAEAWLAGIPAYSNILVDTGRRYNGHPVFEIEFKTPRISVTTLVYSFTPLNSHFNQLAFVPEGALLDQI